MDDEDIKWLPTSTLASEEGTDDFSAPPDMEPYVRFVMSALRGGDTTVSLREIAEIPLQKRYVWRVASELKWAFADFDDLSVAADRDTLSPEDMASLLKLLTFRPTQLCLFLKALVGVQEMKRIMVDAISGAARAGA
jgi:hypothetical protein